MNFLRRAWVETDLSALSQNVQNLKKMCKGKELISVVKANAYGHGAEIVCRHLVFYEGLRFFAVSNIEEAEIIADICPDILIFGYTDENYLKLASERNYILTVGSLEFAALLSKKAAVFGKFFRTHIKIDTGMGRVGIDSIEDLEQILTLKGLKLEGIYTHFACADSIDEVDITYTKNQNAQLFSLAEKAGLPCHSQGSSGLMYYHDMKVSYTRPGISLYGLKPNPTLENPFQLKQVMTLKTAAAQVKRIPAEKFIGYGRTYKTDCEITVAMFPIGYADGLPRKFSNNGYFVINGIPCPIIGRVCMDQTMIDVSGARHVVCGTEALVYSQESPYTDINNLAVKLGTIPHELTCAVNHRVTRVAVR